MVHSKQIAKQMCSSTFMFIWSLGLSIVLWFYEGSLQCNLSFLTQKAAGLFRALFFCCLLSNVGIVDIVHGLHSPAAGYRAFFCAEARRTS